MMRDIRKYESVENNPDMIFKEQFGATSVIDLKGMYDRYYLIVKRVDDVVEVYKGWIDQCYDKGTYFKYSLDQHVDLCHHGKVTDEYIQAYWLYYRNLARYQTMLDEMVEEIYTIGEKVDEFAYNRVDELNDYFYNTLCARINRDGITCEKD